MNHGHVIPRLDAWTRSLAPLSSKIPHVFETDLFFLIPSCQLPLFTRPQVPQDQLSRLSYLDAALTNLPFAYST